MIIPSQEYRPQVARSPIIEEKEKVTLEVVSPSVETLSINSKERNCVGPMKKCLWAEYSH